MNSVLVRFMKAGLVATAAWWVVLSSHPAGQEPAPDYAIRMTADRAQRLLTALNQRDRSIAGELLVKFRPDARPTDQTRALSVLRRPGASASRWIGDVLLVEAPGESDPAAAAAMVARQPEVEWAQPNYLRRSNVTPNDPDFSGQWNFNALDMPRAWDVNPGASSAVKVAVVDTGITATTATFNFRLWTGDRFETVAIPYAANSDIAAARILPGHDFVFWNGPVLDMNGHGSHVAGTILQETNNNVGPAGMAYGATLLPVKVCLGFWDIQLILGSLGVPGFVDRDTDGVCEDADVATGIRYAADQGAQVINVSLGDSVQSPIIRDAMQYAVAHGAFMAISAGNSFEEGNPIDYPAAYAADINGAVAVGAVGRSLRRAFYSSSGSYVELAAPGGDDRDGGNAGLIVQTSLLRSDLTPGRVIRPRFDHWTSVALEGTSMAAPHVAGAAALLYAQGINQPAAIEAALERFATDLGKSGRDNDFGFGLINPRASLRGLGLVK